MGSAYVDSGETKALLQLAREGRADAVSKLFSRHLAPLRQTVARRLRPETQARFDISDVIQETHQQALRQLDDFLQRRPMPFRLWLLKTAHQRLIDLERVHLRASKRALTRELPLPDGSSMDLARHVMGTSRSPDDEAAVREQGRIVRRCLADLAEMDREVLLLRVFEGLKNVEIAAVLDIHPDAAKKRFARSLLRLRRLLTEAGIQESQE